MQGAIQVLSFTFLPLTGTGGLPVCMSTILSFEMRAKTLHLRPSYHIGLSWIGRTRRLISKTQHQFNTSQIQIEM